MKPASKLLLRCSVAAALGVSTLPALAVDWNASVGMGVWHSDNETRSNTTKLDEITYEPNASVNVAHQTRTLQLDAAYRVERRDFKDDLQLDQTVLTGSGSLYWEALPNRFDVQLRQNNTEATGQPFARGTQDNRQEIRTSEAAPRLRFRVRGTDELQFEYRYRHTEAELTQIESDAEDLIARYVLNRDASSSLSHENLDRTTEYDLVSAPDLDRRNINLTYVRNNERSNINATIGQTEFSRDGRDDVDGIVGNVLWIVPFTPRSSFNLNLARTITDNAAQFLNRGNRLDPSVPGVQIDNTDLVEVSTLDTFRAAYNFQIGANRWSLFANRTNQDFEDVPRDFEQVGVGISVARDLRQNLQAQLAVRQIDTELEQLTAGDFEQWFINAGLFWTPTRNLQASFLTNYTDRDGEAISGNFQELRFYVGLTYSFGPGQRPQAILRNR